MGIHREGTASILLVTVVALGLIGLTFVIDYIVLDILLISLALFLEIIILQFFRKPDRTFQGDPNVIYAPADGKVVVIEQTEEGEYFQDERIQVSIFMSPLNVHINWFPISGRVAYSKYQPGKYLVAWHPKSSTLNERTTVVVDTGKYAILLRQIAGAMARRIVCYALKDKGEAAQGEEMGFIKFGSRVDIFLPTNAEVLTELEAKVTGNRTPIARIPG